MLWGEQGGREVGVGAVVKTGVSGFGKAKILIEKKGEEVEM